ncbi:MAG: HTH-type transcriptional regulator DmlR [Stenotrophomonas maltophilia]|uniref:HTH-type transcriptional regulator DmlR n=1 Tax=Stenotrophomonas maltophilia TaxID=40324 RepID=A0A7V8FJ79_STEMA|nr:MAG: HTH-type transcriptional regulator DmlR [Stenotrophomonas maltophilia]
MSSDGRLLSGMSVLPAVVEAGSFSRAGEVLGMSTSGVSRAITRLEERLGIRLLERSTRSLRLTHEGARLYEQAAPHLEGLEEAASHVSGAAVSVRGRLRVSLNRIFARQLLAPRLHELHRRYPGLELVTVPPLDSGELIGEGIDVAVRFGPQPASTMSSRLLLQTRVMTVAAPAYLARCGRPVRPEDLAGHACIQYIDPQRGRPFEWEFHRQGQVVPVDTQGPLTTGDVDLMVQACVAGAGIAQTLELNVRELLDQGRLVDLFPDCPDEVYPLYAVRPSRRLAPAAVEAFLDFCVEICAPADPR